jgi:pyruvate/2-oxoglutarate dehydrogenase complex dihydrolipoamide dehydrogenase (E3) component
MSVAIVGAGLTGLACAAELGADVRVEVLDRIPVTGGVHGWGATETRTLTARAVAAGAVLHLGVTATRWEEGELVGVGPEGVVRCAADALVIAGGCRPRTRAELGLAGPRPAGVVPAPAACHLAENGLPAGRRVCVIGGGDWAHRAAHELLAAGSDVTVVAPDGLHREMPERAATREDVVPTGVEGGLRVTALVAGEERIACDAVVLAHGLVPLRNVDGAVWEAPGVVFAQPIADPMTTTAAREAGVRAAADVRALLAARAAA